ncbi:hypothetical protein CK203_093521 [Vitis vinifera]|uniref:Retrotransposon gag domain-containing protein n=1 Tax=Vitis vinifera TaxID=29760 RepID=A0A438D6J5_VITVI|nr:hypothetical protein CK203_093521 [Vitis vinifera]
MVQNVYPHRDPVVTPVMRNVHSHPAEQPTGRNIPNEPPIGSISKRLDDMLSTPFCSHIINYEPPRGFLVPKFSTYDGTNDPFDHIMHYRQLMTLDIGNDALLCKVFPASLQGQALSWFHRLPPNSVGNFRDLSEAFVGQYLCSARHKQNISTLQNIKMQDNESLREFVKRFGQRASSRGLACPTSDGLNPLERTHPQGIVVGDVPSTRIMAYNRDMPSFPVSVERLIKAGHLSNTSDQIMEEGTHPNITTPEPLGPQLSPRPL